MSANAYLANGLRPGDIIAGKYRVDRVLGTGGMGVVLAAHHIQLDERVAIKLLLPEVLDVPEAVARFAREARAAVKIKSEHVARVTDVGTAESGAPYMVMEYLEGVDLSGWLKQRGALPIKQAVEFVLQACEAIAEAHSIGIVHRDLKPANLFCITRPDGTYSVKVLDFGISKVTGSQSGNSGLGMTRTSAMMGTPYYMSPEQLRSSRDVDARTDIWALGAILYELLTAKVPFDGESIPELCVKIMQTETPLLRATRPEVPAALEQAVCRCLQKERDNRYSNVAEFAAALGPCGPTRARISVDRVHGIIQGAGLSASALAPPPSSDNFEQAAGQTGVAWGQTAAPSTRRAKWIVIGFLFAAAALGLSFVWGWRARTTASNETPATSAAQAAPSLASSATHVEAVAEERQPPASVAATTSSSSAPTAASSNAIATGAAPIIGRTINDGNWKSPAERGDKRPSARAAPSTTNATPAAATAPAKPNALAKPNCDPPYTLDDQGRKHFKAECF